MTEVILGVVMFTGVILALVVLILVARTKLFLKGIFTLLLMVKKT